MAEETTPTAPAEAPQAPESVADNSTNTNPAPAQAPDMHGFTSEQLAEMKKFFDNNGGFNGVKAKISNPDRGDSAKDSPSLETDKKEEPTSHTQEESASQTQGQQQTQTAPQGAITAQEFLAKQYFKSLAGEEQYKSIADGIANGDYLKEMSAFGIRPLNPDGSINDDKVRMYLDLKAQTVPAKPSETEPNASPAPTATYTEVGDNITSIDQAYKVLMEPGNPGMAKAEEYIRNAMNPNSKKSK